MALNSLINLYNGNPSDGLTDGLAVSLDDDISNLITGTVNASENQTVYIKAALRCESGYKTTGDTTIWFSGTNADKWAVSATENGIYNSTLVISDTIEDTNKTFWLAVSGQNGEIPAIDTGTKIRVSGSIETAD